MHSVNRKEIDLYSYIFNNKNKVKDIEEDLLKDNIKIDVNKSRFRLISNIYNKIKCDDNIYNSNFIFNYYTFKKLNKKGLEYLFVKLENICNKSLENTHENRNEEVEKKEIISWSDYEGDEEDD